MVRPHYHAPKLSAFKIFRKGSKVLNGLYGYQMYQVDTTTQNNIIKNARRNYREVNRDYGNGTSVDQWIIIPAGPNTL